MPATLLLPDLARRHALDRPFAPAVLDRDALWSWAELDRRATSIGAALTSRGFGPGDRIGLVIGGTALGIAALHGVPRAGVDVVLVHPRLSRPEIAALLEVAGCRALIVDPATGIAAPPGIERINLGEVIDAGTRALPPAPETTAAAETAAETTAKTTEFIVPTSGTTAHPKLARLPLDRLAASAAAWNAVLPEATGWLLSLGLAHVAGLGIVSRAAAAGVPVVVLPDLGAGALLATVDGAAGHGIIVSHLSLVATQLAGLLDALADAPPPDGIRAVILGGGPIPDGLVRRAIRARWPVIPSYGMTETASGVVAEVLADRPGAERAAAVGDRAGTVGRPLPSVELRLDGGEIQVRGPMVFAGYLDDPAATAAAITADGWLRTGDLGRLDADGRLTIDGRSDGLIVSGGENISPAEVEAALATHPGVREVAVVGVPDPTWGHVPVAILVMEPGANPSDDELTGHARSRLARYKVPARLIRVPSLPHTPLGKVQRRDLPALAQQGDPALVEHGDPAR